MDYAVTLRESKMTEQKSKSRTKITDRKMGLVIFYIFLKSPHRGQAEKAWREEDEEIFERV
jgi:hypothetical protein